MHKQSTMRRAMVAGKLLVSCAAVMSLGGCVTAGSTGQAVPFSAGVGRPTISVPPNATDTHHHIYDARFPADPKSTLRPPDATVADYKLLQKRLGTSRNVIVQPSTYGVDNRGLIAALKAFGPGATRGVAVVNDKVTDAELKELNAAGVRGIRFNLSVPGGATTLDMVLPLCTRIKPMGWHIQVVAKPETIAANADIWNKSSCPIVFDHLGHVTELNDPAMGVVVKLMQQKKAWVKLSGAYIRSKVGAPTYADRAPIATAFIRAAPDQVVWGSDWPHPTSKPDNKPDDAILLSLLGEWAGSDALIKRILVDNPARLYGF